MKRLLMFMALLAIAGMVFYACGSSSSGFFPTGTKTTSTMYFAADDGYLGTEVYKTRGTAASTALVNDINVSAATGGVLSSNPMQFTEAGGKTYFIADVGADTWVVHVINSTGGAEPVTEDDGKTALMAMITEAADTLYIVNGTGLGMVGADGMAHAVYEDNGTVQATVSGDLKDDGKTVYLINGTEDLSRIGADGRVYAVTEDDGETPAATSFGVLFEAGGTVYFYNATGMGMVGSDGMAHAVYEAGGTTQVTGEVMPFDVGGDVYTIDYGSGALGMINAAGNVVVVYHNNGTTPVMLESAPTADVGGTLYYNDALLGLSFVNSAGKPERVMGPGGETGLDSTRIWVMDSAGSRLVFDYYTTENGLEPYIINSSGSAEMLMEINQCNDKAGSSNPQFIDEVSGVLYFTATDCEHGYELWRTQGTAASTMMVKDINVRTDNANPAGPMGELASAALFSADGGNMVGIELFGSDGTEANTAIVKDMVVGSGDSSPMSFIEAGTNVFFMADTATATGILGVTDGTEAGTTMVTYEDGGADVEYVELKSYVTANNTIYFVNGNLALMTVNTTTLKAEEILIDGSTSFTDVSISMDEIEAGFVFASEGTAGVYLVEGLIATEVLADVGGSLDPVVGIHDDIVIANSVTVTGEKTMYVYDDANVEFVELLTTTGWALGDIQGGEFATNGNFYIVNASTTHSMFEIDGTTLAVANVAGADVDAGSLIEAGGVIYWTTGGELWFLDPANSMTATAIGGVDIKETTMVVANSTAYVVDISDDRVYLIDSGALTEVTGAYDKPKIDAVGDAVLIGDASLKLWAIEGDHATKVTDGTNDIALDNISDGMTAAGKFFMAYDTLGDGVDVDLWVVNPATDATLAVNLDINTNKNIKSGNSNPSFVFAGGTEVVFSAFEPATGVELYVSDGTAAGTSMVKDINTDTLGALPAP